MIAIVRPPGSCAHEGSIPTSDTNGINVLTPLSILFGRGKRYGTAFFSATKSLRRKQTPASYPNLTTSCV